MARKRFACPCCGMFTLEQEPPGTNSLCPVCHWEDDAVQYDDPSFEFGANAVSLQQARDNYRTLGASSPEWRESVRPPTQEEQ